MLGNRVSGTQETSFLCVQKSLINRFENQGFLVYLIKA